MPLTITEDAESRRTREVRREGSLVVTMERRFTIQGSDDPASAAVRRLGPQVGEVYSDGALGLVALDRSWDVLVATGASGSIRLTVNYGPPELLPEQGGEEPEQEFSTIAETAHIERALKPQTHYPASANSSGDLIGVQGDTIQGVDIYVPKPSWKQTREVQSLSSALVRTLTDLSSCINNAPWKYWQANEVLFLGARAKRKGRGKVLLEYNFAIQPNTSQSVTTVSGVQTFDKPGWDYMWFSRVQQATESAVNLQIESAHVAQVYRTADFSRLGLGR